MAPPQIKGLQLEDVITITPKDFPLIFALQPPFSTMVTWHQASRAVNLFYNTARTHGKFKKLVDLNFMTPWQLEILCEEWLRKKGHLEFKLVQTGKSMKSFDVVGINKKGGYVIGQVKHSGSRRDFDNFCLQVDDMPDTSSAFYFDSEKNISAFSKSGSKNIQLISVQDVFDYFQKKQPEVLKRLIYG